jgi:translation initiation factor 5
LVLAELLFSANITVDIKKHRNLLLRFTHEDEKAQKYLIGGVEQIIALHAAKEAKLMEKVPIIFKLFYDTDLLDEKVILDWAAKVSKKYVSKEVAQQIHDKAAPFIKWLKEAEEESEDSESDVEIGFDDRAKVDSLKVNVVKPTTPAKPAEDEGDDDLNIDDI